MSLKDSLSMTNKRLGEICKVLSINRLAGVKLRGNSIFEKELAAWFAGPSIPLPVDWPGEGLAQPVPIQFEQEYPVSAKLMMDAFAAGKVLRINLSKFV